MTGRAVRTKAQAIRSTGRWLAGGVAFAVTTYATCVGITWYRYGQMKQAQGDDADPLLDRFMPEHDVVERHHVHVAAPAEITLAAAREMELFQSPLVRAIVRGREMVLGSRPDEQIRPRALLPLVQSLGWGVLAEVPEREIVVGAVTKPWASNVTFRALPPGDFAEFHEPGYVKIAWTLRADPTGPTQSVFRTETRVTTTDANARTKFRRYWSFFSPGIVLIRWMLLRPLKHEAERRAREVRATQRTEFRQSPRPQ